jgi:KUP system potassium uptake protein
MRVQGQAIYMTGDPWGVPVALLHNLKHNKVLHELTAILTIATKEIPVVDGVDKVKIELVGPNVYRIFASYGFMEMPKIQDILRICKEKGINFDTAETTFVLGRETILPSANPGMSIWREKLFAVMARNALKPTAFFDIPPNQVIEVGIQVEI